MRLGQLARKLEVSPTLIIEFLQKDFSDIDGTNSKLSDDQIALVRDQFGGSEVSDEAVEIDTATPEEINEPPTPELVEEAIVNETILEVVAEGEEVEEPELIKAPKISLPGLKVVGKIDLPEPKPVEEKEEKEEKADKTDTRTRVRRENRRRKPNSRSNPIAEERKRKEREERRKRELKKKRTKEKRRKYYEQHYARTVEPQQKVDTKKQEVEIESPEPAKPRSKNWLVRMWRALDAK